MITEAHVMGYQSLQDVEVELGPLTVIVGPSNSGKSAFIRALSALFFNQAGADFIRSGEKSTRILLTMDDGRRIGWQKPQRGGAEYQTLIDGEDRHYTKFGAGVPEDIEQFLGIRRLDIDGLKITPQVAGQFDLPFLLTESAQKAARVISKITRLDVVLSAAAAAKRDLSRVRGRHTDVQARREALEEEENATSVALKVRKATYVARRKVYGELQAQSDFIDEAQGYLDQMLELRKLDAAPVIDPVKVNTALLRTNWAIVLSEKLAAYQQAEFALSAAEAQEQEWLGKVKRVEDTISQFGTCPTCGGRIVKGT